MSMQGGNLFPSPEGIFAQQHHQSESSGGGSITPLVVVLVVIGILGTAAAVLGRLCSTGRFRIGGDYDVEEWIEHKCSSCIDGRVELGFGGPPATATPVIIPVAKPVENIGAANKVPAEEPQAGLPG